MAREHGFLKLDALRQGYRDQWSQTIGGETRTVEILMYEDEVVVATTVGCAVVHESTAKSFDLDIHAARRHFRREVRRLKKGA